MSGITDVIVMKGHDRVIGFRTGLWTMMLSAGVIVLLLVSTAAGATWVVDDDDGGTDRMGMQVAEAAG